MTLELTRREAEELLKVLESYLSELRMEIAGTDSWDYRQGLKKRKVVLNELLQQVQAPVQLPLRAAPQEIRCPANAGAGNTTAPVSASPASAVVGFLHTFHRGMGTSFAFSVICRPTNIFRAA